MLVPLFHQLAVLVLQVPEPSVTKLPDVAVPELSHVYVAARADAPRNKIVAMTPATAIDNQIDFFAVTMNCPLSDKIYSIDRYPYRCDAHALGAPSPK